MANDVLHQTADNEVHLSSNQIARTIIETSLPFANDENFERFQRQFTATIRPICSDKFASQVLQKLVSISMLRAVAPLNRVTIYDDVASDGPVRRRMQSSTLSRERYHNLTTVFNETHRRNCRDFVETIGKFLLNNLKDFIESTYGSQVMQTCLDSLKGEYSVKSNYLTNESEVMESLPDDKRLTVSSEWLQILKDYATRLKAWPQDSERDETVN